MQTATEVPKRKALGKGLESLLPRGSATVESGAAESGEGKPREIPVGEIERSPFQTRTRFDEVQLAELAESIAATGVVQPIVVRPLPHGNFQLIAGERRWLASQRAGKETIPAIVRQVSDEQAMEMTIVENLQRSDLNPMEQARAYERLSRDFQLTQEQMAKRTGKDRASVGNFLRLLKLPTEVQSQVEEGILTFGHARALLPLEDPQTILKAAKKITSLTMSVRQTESYVQKMLHPEEHKSEGEQKENVLDPNVREVQDSLQRALGLKVRIEDRKGRGRVIIEYGQLEEFDRLLDRLRR
ncbi:MAG TPA: ParB/RepB/Spo0J family partition protein [Acidobacteriaceae bacterium]|jgi:ParB family chromosome partitioning protein|nr:ParB/RepB/Spo0J family partition protein [Acidobacteriaceae bacterium]